MLRRPLSFVALTVLAALGACVAVAAFAAPSRASAHTGVACPLSRLTAAKSFKGRLVEILEEGMRHKFFPELWEIRSHMTDKWGAEYGVKRDPIGGHH